MVTRGPIPHFHIENPKDKNDIVCIGIFEAKYFSHQANVLPKTLDKKILKALDKTLRQPYKKMGNLKYSNWDHIKDTWIQQNGIAEGYKNKYTDNQPDYTKTSGEI